MDANDGFVRIHKCARTRSPSPWGLKAVFHKNVHVVNSQRDRSSGSIQITTIESKLLPFLSGPFFGLCSLLHLHGFSLPFRFVTRRLLLLLDTPPTLPFR